MNVGQGQIYLENNSEEGHDPVRALNKTIDVFIHGWISGLFYYQMSEIWKSSIHGCWPERDISLKMTTEEGHGPVTVAAPAA